MKNLSDLVILIRGAGELASGVAYRLYRSHFQNCLTDIDQPQAVRRTVSFCEAVYDGEKEVATVSLIKPERLAEEYSKPYRIVSTNKNG